MNLEKEIEKLIGYDRKTILKRIKKLRVELEIDEKLKTLARFNDDIEYIILRNIDSSQSFTNLKTKLKGHKNLKIELRCSIKGKKKYIKNFGVIENISEDKLYKIFQFSVLFRLSKKINEASLLAAQYYTAKKNKSTF